MEDFALLQKRGYILVVEGAIPFGAQGRYCGVGGEMTIKDAVAHFGQYADLVLAVGTCAAFGGVSAGAPNPTGAKSVSAALAELKLTKTVINLPGCPVHPDWLVGTIVDLIVQGKAPAMDSLGRPTKYFGLADSRLLSESGVVQIQLQTPCRQPWAWDHRRHSKLPELSQKQ